MPFWRMKKSLKSVLVSQRLMSELVLQKEED